MVRRAGGRGAVAKILVDKNHKSQMSAVREGDQLTEMGRATSEALEQGVVTGAASNGGVQGGAVAGQFPRQFDARTPMDDVMRMRQQLADKDGKTPFGDLQFSDDQARWLLDKEKAAEAANCEFFFTLLLCFM